MTHPVTRAPGPGLSPSLPPALSAITAELISMQRRVTALERGARTAQLASSSVEAGTITFNDATETAQMVIGLQQDGTHAVVQIGDGAPEPPSDPTVQPGISSLFVTWDGSMADGSDPLSDFAYVLITCTPYGTPPGQAGQGGGVTAATVTAQLAGPGLIVIGSLTPYQPYLVTFNMVNQAGNLSPPSSQVPGTPTGVIDNIAAGTITAALLEAGIIIAGAVNGTTISGAQFVAFGGNGELLMYASDPSLGGALTGSISTVSQQDQYGNAYVAGVMSYVTGSSGGFVPSGYYVAQGWQAGQMYFGTASTAAGPYTQASGTLRGLFGAFQTGYSNSAQDSNGNNDPLTLTQLDARTIAMGGRVLTTSAWTNNTVITNVSGGAFILPPTYPAANVPDIPVVNSNGGAVGNLQLHPNGNIYMNSTQFGTNYTVCCAGTFRW